METQTTQKFVEAAKRAMANCDHHSKSSVCDRYKTTDYVKYINGNMDNGEKTEFKEHCNVCPECLEGLYQADRKDNLEVNQKEDKYLFHKTIEILDKIDIQKTSKNIVKLFIKISDTLMEIIETTGKIITAKTPVTVRGEKRDNNMQNSIQIVEDLSTPPLSAQLTISQQENSQFCLHVSLFQPDLDEFMSDVQFFLKDDKRKDQYTTDIYGEVIIPLETSGSHVIICKTKNEPLAEFNISIK